MTVVPNLNLLQAVDAGILVVNAETMAVLHANPKALTLLGATAAEIEGRRFRSLLYSPFPGSDRSWDLRQPLPTAERHLLGAQGRPLSVLLTANPMRTPSGLVSIITFTDISSLKLTELRYKSFFDNAVEGIFQSTPEGRFIAVNPALAKILGYDSPEDVLGALTDLRTQLYVDPEDRDRLFETLKTNGQVNNFETRFKRKDGGVKWISAATREVRDEHGNLLYIEGLNADITPRKLAEHSLREVEKSLRESEEKFRRTFDQSPIGASILNLDFTVLRVNEAFCRITGYTEPELMGTSILDLTHPDDRDNSVERTNKVGAGQAKRLEWDKRYIHKDGHTVWVNISVGLVRDSQGQPLYYLPMVQDVTERKLSELNLRQVMDEKENLRLNLEAVFRSIPDAIIVVDTEMRVLQTNRALSEICCVGGEMSQGKPLHLVSGHCKRACFEVISTTLKTRESVAEYRVECLGRTPGKTVVINSSPLLDRDNNFVGAVLVIRDITRLADLEKRLTDLHGHRGLIGKSKAMRGIYAVLDQLSEIESTVLITGESGTGKELVAEALHYGGPRAKGPLVKVNCSALSENLLESELFGHVRGAFTGAIRDKIGRFEAAEGGTILLDEIGDVSPRIQLNLLRFLDRKEFERVGDSKTRKANVRVIAATNVDLKEKIRQGLFREDLFYRLKVMVIHLPSLRERIEDIPLLAEHFISQFRASFGKNIERCSEEVMGIFMSHPWPGNVREFKYVLEHACILCPGGEIDLSHLPQELRRSSIPADLRARIPPLPLPGVRDYRGLSREAIIDALHTATNNRSKAAKLLGVDRRTLYRNMAKHAID